MADLAAETLSSISCQPAASQGPQFGEDVVLDEKDILGLGVQVRDEAELALGAAVGLGFVEGFLVDFILQGFRRAGLAEDAVLAEGEEGFEDILPDGEAED